MALTRRQTELLKFMEGLIDDNGEVIISLKELGRRMGWNSTNAAQNVVNSLILKGYVKKSPPKFACEPNVYQIIQRD